MTKLLDLIFQMVVHPKNALNEITEFNLLKESIVICIISCILFMIAAFGKDSGIIAGFVVILLIVINLIMHAASVHYISSLWNGSGSAKGITSGFISNTIAYAFCVFPVFFAQWGFENISKILFIVIAIWSYVLDVIAIRENYKFTIGKSIVVNFIPQLIILALILLLVVLTTLSAISGIMELQNLESVVSQI